MEALLGRLGHRLHLYPHKITIVPKIDHGIKLNTLCVNKQGIA